MVGRGLRGKTDFWAGPKVERGRHGALPPVTLTTAAGTGGGGREGEISRDLALRRLPAPADLARVGRGRRRGHGLRWEGTAKMASEGELGRKWDRCMADSAVKLGKGGEGRAEGEDPGRSGAGRPGAPGLGRPPPARPHGAAGPGEEGPCEAQCHPPPLRARPRSAVASPRCGPGWGGGVSCGSSLSAG